MSNITVPTKASIVASLDASISAITTSLGDMDDFVDAFVDTLLEVWNDAKDVDDALTLQTTADFVAEGIAGLFSVFRLPGAGATVTVAFTGDNDTPIPAGTRVATAQDVIPPDTIYGGQSFPLDYVIDGLLENASTDIVLATLADATLSTPREVVPGTDDELAVGRVLHGVRSRGYRGLHIPVRHGG